MDPLSSSQTTPQGVPPVTPDQFLKHLADSGLMSAEEIAAFTAKLSPAQRQDVKQLAAELVRQDRLTKYQAQMIYQGKTRGLVLGNHVILDKLGQGGMGMVFKARHRHIGRVVALKVLPPAIAKNPNSVKRFQREVHAAAKLQHRNIVTAYDAGEDKGVHFLVMEFVDGKDLAQQVKQNGPLPLPQAVDCILQTAHGLAHAHASGIIHRDIKPHNLLLSGGRKSPESPGANAPGSGAIVKILDMGLARIEGGNAPGSTTSELTQTGNIMGTCDYMSPEQALNTKHADARSDIYSLGCTLYYLVSGNPMYAGETAMEKLMAHSTEPIPPLPGATDDLQAVYERMVAKKPEDRYASMEEVIADLAALQASGGCEPSGGLASGGRPSPEPSARRRTGGGLAATQTFAAGGTDTAGGRTRSPALRWVLFAAAVGTTALLGTCILVGLFLGLSGSPDTPTASGKQTGPRITGKTPDADDPWIKQVQALPPEKQLQTVAAELKKRNPGFDGILKPRINGGAVTELWLSTLAITDISPVRGLTSLEKLTCYGQTGPGTSKFTDLQPLARLKLKELNLQYNQQVRDLSPLQDMPLESLNFWGTSVTDLTPLQKLPLKYIGLNGWEQRMADPRYGGVLRSIRTLEMIHGRPAAEFLGQAPAGKVDDGWVKQIQALPPEAQIVKVMEKLKERNPQMNGKAFGNKIDRGVVTELHFLGMAINDISPVRALTGLKKLDLTVPGGHESLTNIAGLQGMHLTWLSLYNTRCKDIAPLKGMPLTHLNIEICGISDLSPLKELPQLRELWLDFNPARDGPILRSIRTLEKINGKPAAQVLGAGPMIVPPPGGEIRRFEVGDSKPLVSAVAFSPDGRRMLAASSKSDRNVRIWDVETGQEIQRLPGHDNHIGDATFLPSGRRAVSAGGFERSVRVWDTETGKELKTLWVVSGSSHASRVACSPDGRLLAICGMNGGKAYLALWDVETGKQVRRFTGHADADVHAVAFHPDGRRILSAGQDKTVRLWDVESGKELRQFLAAQPVRGLAFTPDGRTFLVAGDGAANNLTLYDVEAWQEIRRFSGHTDIVFSVAISADGTRAVSASRDQSVRLWEVSSGKELHRFTGHRGQVRCVAISRDGRFALSGGEDGTARLWQLPGSGPPPQPVVRPGPVGEIRRFDTQPGAVLSLAYSPDGSQALAGCGDQTIRLWDVQTGRELKRFKSLAGDVISVAFAGPGKILFGGSNKSIRTLDQVTGQEVDRMGIHGAWVYPPDFSPDRRRALNPMSDKSFWLWDLETRKPVLELQGHTTTVVCAAFSPDARLAVSGSSDKTVRVWDLATGKELKTFFGHGSTITGVAFAPDGRHVLSGSRDKTLRWWSVETGNEVLCLKGHADAVQAIAISPTGRHAVSGSGGTWLGNKYVPGTEHLLRLWDLQTGQEIARFQGHTGDINCIAFSPDGRTFLSGSADMTVRLWQFPAPGPVPSQDLLPGLAATFFEGGEWEKGKVAVQQVDPNVSYYWGMKDPHPGLSVSNFSARWVGVLKILQPGRYTFAITADDSGSLWIDGKLLIDGKRDLRAYRGQAEIELVPGDHEIRLECFNRVGGAFCGLRWSLKDGFAEQFVPPDVLFHRPR